MKNLFPVLFCLFSFTGIVAQENSVAIVRHITSLGGKEKHQKLVVSVQGKPSETILLEQQYFNDTESIASDDQKIIGVFSGLLNDGYKLIESNSSDFDRFFNQTNQEAYPVYPVGAREIIYVFIKD